MSKVKRRQVRSLFLELLSGVGGLREHREGLLTLRTHRVDHSRLRGPRS
jgi:hypothetical protein